MSAWTATGVTHLVGGREADAEGAVAAGSSSFTAAPPPLPSIADVVAQGGHDELGAFVQLFEEAAIDTELACEMDATELAGLLPPGTPFGHALRLRKLFAAAAAAAKQPHARIPHGPAWQHGARFIAAGTMQGDLSASLQFILDLVLIISSLLLSLSISPLLTMPEACADGSDCRGLRSADALLWAVSAGCFLGAVLSGWIVLTLMAAVSTSQRAKWFEDHWGRVVTPMGLTITGITTVGVAIGTRLLIGSLSGGAFSGWVKWAAFGVLQLLVHGCGWGFWLSMSHSTYGWSCCEFFAFQGGVQGLRLPRKQVGDGAALRESVPYFDKGS